MAIVTEWAKVAGRFRTNRYGMELVGENIPEDRKQSRITSNDIINDTKKYIENELKKFRTK